MLKADTCVRSLGFAYNKHVFFLNISLYFMFVCVCSVPVAFNRFYFKSTIDLPITLRHNFYLSLSQCDCVCVITLCYNYTSP